MILIFLLKGNKEYKYYSKMPRRHTITGRKERERRRLLMNQARKGQKSLRELYSLGV